MFSQVSFDMAAALADKENVCSTYPAASQKSVAQFSSPARTPLSDVRNTSSQGRLSRRRQYSPVTPVSCGKMRSRSLGRLHPQQQQQPGNLLTSLLYKETLKVLHTTTEDLKSQLSEKENYIYRLESQNQPSSPATSSPMRDVDGSPESTQYALPDLKLHSTVTLTPATSSSAQSAGQAPPPTCQSSEQAPPTCQSSEQAPPTCQSPEQGPPSCHSAQEELSIVPALVLESDEEETEKEGSENTGLDSDGLQNEDEKNEQSSQVETHQLEEVPTVDKTNSAVSESSLLPKQMHGKRVSPSEISKALAINLLKLTIDETSKLQSDEADEASGGVEFDSPQRSVSHGCSPHPTPRPLRSFSEDGVVRGKSQCDPIPQPAEDSSSRGSIDTACSPIIGGVLTDCLDADCAQTIPVRISRRSLSATEEFGGDGGSSSGSDSVASSPRRLSSPEEINKNNQRDLKPLKTAAATEFDNAPPRNAHASVGCSPMRGFEHRTPVHVRDSAVGTTPIQMRDSVVEMQVLIGTADANFGTTPVRQSSSYTETNQVDTQSTGTSYTPMQTRTSACGPEEVAVASKNIGTTPVRPKESSGTMVTPVRLVSTATCRSPLQSYNVGCNTMPPATSDTYVATDAISTDEVGTMVSPVKTCESSVGSDTVLVTTETETSMTPVKQQEMSTATTPLQYRQTNIYSMLESLHSQYTKSQDYQALYEESQQRLAELEAQLQCYTQLSPILKEANSAQAEASDKLQRSFQHARTMCENAKAEKEKLAAERSMFESERAENERVMQAAMEEYASMKKEYTEMRDKTETAQQQAQQYESELTGVREALSASQQENAALQSQLQQTNKELSTTKKQLALFHSGLKDAKNKNDSLLQTCLNLQSKIEELELLSKESSEFSENEQAALRDELMETRETLTAQLTKSQAQLQQTRRLVGELEEELEGTRNSAHLHVVSLNAEITDSIVATGNLSDKLEGLHQQLLASAAGLGAQQQQQQQEEEEAETQAAQCTSKSESKPQPMSLLASVLAFINDTEEEAPTAPSPPPPSPSPPSIASSSAFTRLLPSANQSALPESHDQIQPIRDESPEGEESVESEEEVALNEQITELGDVVENIRTVIRTIQQAVLSKNTALKQTIERLEQEREESAERSGRQLREERKQREDCEKRLQDAHRSETTLRREMVAMRDELHSRQRELGDARHLLIQRADRQQELADQSSQIKRAESEVRQLQQRLVGKESECQLLEQAMQEATAQPGRDRDVRTKYLLRKEVNSLKLQLLQMNEQAQQLADKANSRSRTYEQNLKKAEHEISVLDNMIDKIRQVILRHKDQTVAWPEMRRLWPELIGGEHPHATTPSTNPKPAQK